LYFSVLVFNSAVNGTTTSAFYNFFIQKITNLTLAVATLIRRLGSSGDVKLLKVHGQSMEKNYNYMKSGIIIDEDSMYLRNDGKIMGDIYLKLKDTYFPFKHWNDFLSVILSWWLREIIDYFNNKIEVPEFLFMDGSYGFKILPNEHGGYSLLCYDDMHFSDKVSISENIELLDFLDSLIFSIELLISKYNHVEDFKKMEVRLETLKSLKSRFS
jgi:hypothetical protein